jgi:hypothetical protein
VRTESNHIEYATPKTDREESINESGFSIRDDNLVSADGYRWSGNSLSFYYSFRNTDSAGNRELAMAVAQQQMEQLRTVGTAMPAWAQLRTSTTVTSSGPIPPKTIVDSNVVNGDPTVKTITIKSHQTVTRLLGHKYHVTVWVSDIIAQRTALTVGPYRAP